MMLELLLTWAVAHPILALLLYPLPPVLVACLLAELLKTVQVAVRGYPPEHVLRRQEPGLAPPVGPGEDPQLLFLGRMADLERRMKDLDREMGEVIHRLPPLPPLE